MSREREARTKWQEIMYLINSGGSTCRRRAGISEQIGNHTFWVVSVLEVDNGEWGKVGIYCVHMSPLAHFALIIIKFFVVQSLRHVQLFGTP